MAIIANLETPSAVIANYHRVDLSEIRITDGKAHVRVLSYLNKAARAAGADHIFRQMVTVDFDRNSSDSLTFQIYREVKKLFTNISDDEDEINAYLQARQSTSAQAQRAAILASQWEKQTSVQPTAIPIALAGLAFPDESLADLKTRLLTELTTLRSMAVGQIPMTEEQRAMLTTLEGQVAQQWFTS